MNTDKRGEALFRHAELTRQIVGVFFQVYGELGYGFLESVYRTAMTIALREAGRGSTQKSSYTLDSGDGQSGSFERTS